MSQSRIKNTRRILVSGIVNRVVNSLLPFVNRTVILWILGAEFTGLHGLFSSVLQVLNLAEFGFNTAIVYSLYEPLAKNDTDAVCVIVSLLRRVYHFVGAVVLLMGFALMPLLPKLIKGSYPSSINLYLLFFLFLLNSAISYFLFAYRETLLIADQRQDIVTNIRTMTGIAVSFLQLGILLVFRDFYFYVLVTILGTVSSNLMVASVSRKRYPYLRIVSEKIAFTGRMKKQVAGLMINRLSNVSRNALDSLIVSSTLGLVATAIYGNYYLVYSAVFGFVAVISSSMQASVGNSMVLRSVKENYENLLDFSFLYSWIVGWCAVVMACLYQPFMKLWVGDSLMLPEVDMLLFVLYFYLINMNHIRNQYLYGAGMWWEMKEAYLLETIGNLVLNIVLGKLLGITGILLATILTIFVFNYLLCNAVLFKHYFQGERIAVFYRQQFYYLGVAVFVVAVTYYVCSYVQSLIVIGLICLVLPNLLFVLLFRPCSRWKSCMKLLRRIIRR